MTACFKYLEKKSDEDIVFIVESFTGLLKGSKSVMPVEVKSYFEKVDRLNIGMQRFDFSKFPVQHYKDMLAELFGPRAKNLGIVTETKDGKYEPTGKDFPKEKRDFLNVYRLLTLMCKYSIAKHDELQVIKAIEKCEDELEKNND